MLIFATALWRVKDRWEGSNILKIFIKTMEDIIAFPLILSILAAYYRTIDPKKKNYILTFAIIIGLISSLISTYIRNIPNYINRANLDFYSLIPVLISCVILLILIIFEKRLKVKSELGFENTFSSMLAIYTASSFFTYMPIFFQRIDSFVYYGESAVSTAVLFRVIGFVLAILMFILSIIAIYKTGMKLQATQLKSILLFGLIIRMLPQLNSVMLRLYALGVIPKNPNLFAFMSTMDNYKQYFDFVLMGLLIIAPIILWMQNIKIVEAYSNKAQLRKIVYNMRQRRHLAQFFIFIMIMNILSLSVIKTYANREVPLSAPEEYVVEQGHIEIGLDTLEDENLHRYAYHAKDGKEVRFIAIKKAEGAYGLGLDACEICGPSGYFERNDEVVCKLCDVVMNKGTIGFKGGCNPIPFEYKVHDGKIKIDVNTLEELSYVFK